MGSADRGVLHPQFKAFPYWWEAFRPHDGGMLEVPREVEVAIVGGGYGGLSCALELAREGKSVCVLDAGNPGEGGSTINGGCIMGGYRIGKLPPECVARERFRAFSDSAAHAYRLLQEIISRESISCGFEKGGRFVAAWTPRHHLRQIETVASLSDAQRAGLRIVSRDEQKAVVDTNFYHGGIVADSSAKLHPALYFKGLLDAATRNGVPICAKAEVTSITRRDSKWILATSRGTVRSEHVVVATNGYTPKTVPDLRRRVIPILSHAIATEALDEGTARTLLPDGRTVSETQRVLFWYRMEGRRLIFGGRARFTALTPERAGVLLHGIMAERFPQLAAAKVTHVWSGNIARTFDNVPHTGVMDGIHYALGCNGSGVAMLTYLGWHVAQRLLERSDHRCGFELPDFPTFPFYTGNPNLVLPALGGYYRLRDRIDRLRAG